MCSTNLVKITVFVCHMQLLFFNTQNYKQKLAKDFMFTRAQKNSFSFKTFARVVCLRSLMPQ